MHSLLIITPCVTFNWHSSCGKMYLVFHIPILYVALTTSANVVITAFLSKCLILRVDSQVILNV